MNRVPKNFTQEQRKCFVLMQKLRRHPAAYLFLKKNEPLNEYNDLLSIELNVRQGLYTSILQFWADVRKVCQKDSDIYIKTIEMENYFDELYRDAEKPPQKTNFDDLQKRVDKLTKELSYMSQQNTKVPTQMTQVQNQRRHSNQYPTPSLPAKKSSKSSKTQSRLEIPMTIQEKKNLGMNIRTLPPEQLRGVWEIVSDGLNVQNTNEELEFDIDTLAVKKTRLLERYVNFKLQQIHRQNQKNQESQQNQQQFGQQGNEIVKSLTGQPAIVLSNYVYPGYPAQENDTAESSFSSDPEDSI